MSQPEGLKSGHSLGIRRSQQKILEFAGIINFSAKVGTNVGKQLIAVPTSVGTVNGTYSFINEINTKK